MKLDEFTQREMERLGAWLNSPEAAAARRAGKTGLDMKFFKEDGTVTDKFGNIINESKFKEGDRVRVCKESGEKVPVFFGKKMNVSYIGKTGTVTGTETAKDGSIHVFVEMDETDEKAFGYLTKEFKEEELEKE